MSWLKKHPAALFLIGGIVLIVLTRLPQFLGGHMVPDGDECIVGLMAKHLVEGKDLPVFFYGQRYGYSLLEAWTAGMFFLAAGLSAGALKAAMLLLWSAGALFAVLSVRNFAGKRAAIIAGLLLIFCPAWSIWSMKARGGYLTAFALAHLCIWFISIQMHEKKARPGLLTGIGACVVLVFFSQPIWLLGAAPFVALLLHQRRRLADLWPMFFGAAACAIPLLLIQRAIPDVAWQTDTFGYRDPAAMLRSLPFNLWIQFTGVSPFSDYYEAGAATNVSAMLWLALLVIMSVDFVRRLVRREFFTAAQAAVLACLLTILFCTFVNVIQFGYRYLLALNAFLAIAAAIRLDEVLGGHRRKAAIGVLAALVATGAGAMVEAGGVPSVVPVQPEQRAGISDERAVRRLVEELDKEGIQDVYCFHPTFFWNIILASDERIYARWTEPGGRRLEYGFGVDLALLTDKPTAVVGEIGILPELKRFLAKQGHGRPRVIVVEDAFFILPRPSAKLVTQLGFKPNDPAVLEELLKNPANAAKKTLRTESSRRE